MTLYILIGMIWVTGLIELDYFLISAVSPIANIINYVTVVQTIFNFLSIVSGTAAVIAVFIALKNLKGQEKQIRQAELQKDSQFEYNKKRDRQYSIQTSILNKAAQDIEYFLRKDNFQNAIMATANNIHSWSKVSRRYTEGRILILNDDISSGRYECMMEWKIFYRNPTKMDDTYQFCARFTIFSKGVLSTKIRNGEPLNKDSFKNLKTYELSIHRIEGHYGIFSDKGAGSFYEMSSAIFAVIYNAVSSGQTLNKKTLETTCRGWKTDINPE